MAFRVASFNVTNLNAEGHDFVGRRDTRPFRAAESAAKTAGIAAVLDRLAADVVGLQEVFSEAALRAAVAASPAMAGAAVAAPLAQPIPGAAGVRGAPVSDGPHVGLASRLPVLRVDMLTHFPEGVSLTVPAGLHDAVAEMHLIGIRRWERPILRAEIEVPGLPGLTVLVAHLKSKRGKFLAGEDRDDPVVAALGALRSLVVRAAEAAALRAQVVLERSRRVAGRRRPVIVLGDLNDDLGAVTTAMMTAMIMGPRPFAGADGTAPRVLYGQRTRPMLMSAFEIAPPPAGQGHSYVHDGRPSLIDHILLSADFAPVEGQARARVAATGMLNAHLPPAAAGHALPAPAPLVPKTGEELLADQAARGDPLADPPPAAARRSPVEPFDHGMPFADIDLPVAA
jgi:endonuclease/exonuclease/phosphatase family metal-dependent hydrolase